MKVYDKASWHIDGGEEVAGVIRRFSVIFEFLDDKGMLNENGIETLEYAMDSSVSLNSTMLKKRGQEFLDNHYDVIISQNQKQLKDILKKEYKIFCNEEDKKEYANNSAKLKK